jgi:hypothetical protein
MAKEILALLAAAFGGYSQFGEDEIANAILGRIRNANMTLAMADEIAAECAVILAERWEEDPDPIRRKIIGILREGMLSWG